MSDTLGRTTLTPAYGRDYKSKKDLIADLNKDRDFMCQASASTGPMLRPVPVNLPQLSAGTHTVRYGKLRKVTTVQVKVVDGLKVAK